jgi:acylphosphatase
VFGRRSDTTQKSHASQSTHIGTYGRPGDLMARPGAPICDDGTMTDQKAISATVRCRVQGVGYRYAVIHVAQELGLVGWVQNTPDGSVKTWAQGHDTVLEQFVEFLRAGPRSAAVRSVDVFPIEPDESLQRFVVRS